MPARRATGTTPLPSGAAKTAQVRSMFDAIAPRYALVNRIVSLGLDQRWRRRAIASLALAPGSIVLDLACGTGDLSDLARRSGYRTVGVDLSPGMLAAGSAGRPPRPGDAGVVQGDAAHLGLASASFDGVVCGYALRNFTDLAASLTEAARVLRAGGRLAVLEVSAPERGVMLIGYRIWFERAVPLLGGLLSDPAAYRYLPRSVAYLPDEVGLRSLLLDAGFTMVGRQVLDGGLSQLITATRAGMPEGAPPGTTGPSEPSP
ncbi:MAG: ubiquinone/menaquinone biosynthesis methyltransferase [Acidimicrobiales bacterium]